MGQPKHIVSLSIALATLIFIQNVFSHTIHKKSIFSWLRNGDDDSKDQTKVEHIVAGYKPILEVHKYNGLQINPINGGPPVFFESGAPITVEQLTAGSDQQIANLLYNAVPFLPEEERMHEVNLGPIAPYVQMIPDASIDRLRVTFESNGEEKVGAQGKSKLLKLLEVIREKKLKPIQALYQKKKDAIKSVVNFLSPPPDHPSSHSDTVIVSGSPTLFALPPPPPIFSHPPPPIFSHPPPPPLLVPPPELEFLKFEHPPKHTSEYSSMSEGIYFERPKTHDHAFSEIRGGETQKKDYCKLKDTKCEEHHYSTVSVPTAHGAAPFFHAVNVDPIPPPLPPPPPPPFVVPLAPPPGSDEHHFGHSQPHTYAFIDEGPLHFDLPMSGSEKVERYSAVLPARGEFIDERMNVLQAVASTTPQPQTTPQPHKGTEPSSQSSSTVSPSN